MLLSEPLPAPSWEAFYKAFSRRWEQGEHVFISAQTGAGKTELLLKIMLMRSYATLFVSKPRDPILKKDDAKLFKRQSEFKPEAHDNRIMLVPVNQKTTRETAEEQRRVFGDALDKAYRQGGWALGFDELAYMSEDLRLDPPIKRINHMGRALGISSVSATQRPFRIPVIVRTSATHAFLGPTAREDDLRALSQLGFNTKATRAAIESLTGEHDFVYVDQRRRLPMLNINTRRGT